MATFGIEEEYFLVDPTTLRPASVAALVLRDLSLGSTQHGCVTPEFLASQVELSTAVLTDLDTAAADLAHFRRELASAAQRQGVLAVGTGTPFDAFPSPTLTNTTRYQTVGKGLRGLVGDHQISATHIHVGVPSRAAGVRALNRLRVWLPILAALTGNSPFWRGSDTGFDSWRAVHMRRWATTGCPPCFTDAADYDRRVRQLVGVGGTSDVAIVAWCARLSEAHPTVEVRVADAQLNVAPVLLLAALTRGLVVTALAESERDVPPITVEPEMLDAALWHASRDGIRGELLDPDTSTLQPARVVVLSLVRHIEEALEEAGDRPRVNDLLELLWRTGTGAEQQQLAYSARGLSGLTRLFESSFTL